MFLLFFFFQREAASSIQYQSLIFDVSSVVGDPWRCGVLTTQGGTEGSTNSAETGTKSPPTATAM